MNNNNHTAQTANGEAMNKFERLLQQAAAAEWKERVQRASSPSFCDNVIAQIEQTRCLREKQTRGLTVKNWFGWIRTILNRPVMAMGLGVLLIIGFVIVQSNVWQSPITERVLDKTTDMQAGVQVSFEEIIFRGEKDINISGNKIALYELRNGALQILCDSNLRGKITGNKSFTLHDGRIWIYADDGSQGFQLSTARAQATIVGTIFGISVNGTAEEFRVTKGCLSVIVNGQEIKVNAGKALMIKGGDKGVIERTVVDVSSDLPEWAQYLTQTCQLEHFARYYPSAGKNKLKNKQQE